MKRSSMTCPIPHAMRRELSADPFMRTCILSSYSWHDCEGRIEFNHAVTYAGKRINELWAIIPMCTGSHRQEARFRDIIRAVVKERIAYFNINPRDKYPKLTI